MSSVIIDPGRFTNTTRMVSHHREPEPEVHQAEEEVIPQEVPFAPEVAYHDPVPPELDQMFEEQVQAEVEPEVEEKKAWRPSCDFMPVNEDPRDGVYWPILSLGSWLFASTTL